MSNFIFPRLNKPRVNVKTFLPLQGMKIPAVDDQNTGLVGNWIHDQILLMLRADYPKMHQPDLTAFGIEIKTQDVDTESDLSIGSISLPALDRCDYINSPVFHKLQALLLISRSDTYRVITDVQLHYLDNDEIQSKLDASYNEAKLKVLDHIGGDLKFIFKPYTRFTGEFACLEAKQHGVGLQFRMSQSSLMFMTNLSNNTKVLDKFVTIG